VSEAARRIAVRVSEICEVAKDVKRFRLEALDGSPLPQFAGGAHVIVEMHDGDVTRRNAYSLMSPPWQTEAYHISVRRDAGGRGGSLFLHDRVSEGAILHISYPVNLFPIDHRARKHLLIAGGIGITPFLAMMEHLAREHRPFELHYASRSKAHAAYAEDLAAKYGSRVAIYHDDVGVTVPLTDILGNQPLGTHLYVCGPSGMIDWALSSAKELGWPAQNLHFERFLSPPSGAPYEIRLARSKHTVTVGPHQSMLEAIEAAGVDAPYLCRGGACGQCETHVLDRDGTILHADHFLTDAEKACGEKVMPCVSRFEGRTLVLDL
jgi:ferredoxin-NADP reductase